MVLTACCASLVDAPKCGVKMRLGLLRNLESAGKGSVTKVSSAAPAKCPSSRHFNNASSSTRPPRAALMTYEPFFIARKCTSSRILVVSLVRGICSVIMSAFASSSSSDFIGTLLRPAAAAGKNGSYAATSIPIPCALRATVAPMRPRPITPSFFPSNSKPVRPALGQPPAFIPASAFGICRAKANNNEMACSAAASVLPSGAFITAIPRAVAASTSMVSTPAPARPITLSCDALAMASAVTAVADRTSSASTPSSFFANTAGSFMGSEISTSQPASRIRIKPSS